ncbi:AAA family ATPase [Brevibacterium moorei]|uniref:AAA family ATPase n=1 Tax=Brevibacterium moorei TaxID=2968457 RepID=UPI00211CF287|nr:AAA family ATPase [Brevibacterium sp. 68QC2CO]MCQ9384436.1 AAA family ATPase [Brevibacterium sp. 68QC2CO]
MTTTGYQQQRIVELRAENYKRLKAVRITPDADGLVQITGANGQGKTSVLDALWSALDNATTSKQNPDVIRHGAHTASVRLELDDLIVERTWQEGKMPALKVTSKEGAKLSSPQAVLNALLGSLSFDPTAFLRLRPADQVSQLLDLVELPFDPAQLEADRQEAYDQRTAVNRDAKRLAGAISSLGDVDVTAEPVDIAALTDELSRARNARGVMEEAHNRLDNARADLEDARANVKRLEDKTRAWEAELSKANSNYALYRDPDEVELDLRAADARAEAFQQRQRLEALTADMEAAKEESENLTARIGELDEQKREGLAAADMPVPGLGFNDTGVTYHDVPLQQASTAERLRVATAIAMRQAPALKVLRVQDGNDLDSKSLAALDQQAREHGFQVWIERVDETGTVGVYIEDGEQPATN